MSTGYEHRFPPPSGFVTGTPYAPPRRSIRRTIAWMMLGFSYGWLWRDLTGSGD
jgi:hypothetical protein